MIVVSDATPIILLAKLSDFEFLKTLYQKIYIPQEVYDEIVTKGRGKAGEKELEVAQADWVKVKTVSGQAKIKKLEDVYGLWEGESAAITLSQELKANFLLTDDGLARRVALSLFKGTSTMVSGTIGILKLAREKGVISQDQLKSKIESLKAEGFYLKDDLYRQILREIEKPEDIPCSAYFSCLLMPY